MAIKKEKILKNGITANYWKVVDCDVKSNHISLALYKSKEHATDRKNMIEGRTMINIEWDLIELEKANMNPLKYAYAKVKESKMSEWNNEGDGTEKDFITEETNWFADVENC